MLRREISYTDLTTAAGLSTEETLFVSRLRANEDAAYDELVREYHSSIYHVACRMLNDPGEAADVTQDVFVKVFRNIARFRGQCALKTWIFKVWSANSIKPFAVPAITGVLSTLLLFGMMLDNMEAYGEVPVIAPAQTRIEMTASTYTRVLRPPADLTQPMFVEVHVGEDGKVPHYFVLLGPENDPAVDTWLDDLLFAAVFAPATLDGQPIHSKLIMFLPGISIGVNES